MESHSAGAASPKNFLASILALCATFPEDPLAAQVSLYATLCERHRDALEAIKTGAESTSARSTMHFNRGNLVEGEMWLRRAARPSKLRDATRPAS